MENKALKTDVYTNENIWVDSCEQPIDVDFTLPDYCPDISKIFKCKAVSRISSKSLNDKSITIDGNICITVLYCDKDNNLCSYEYQYPFNKVKEIDHDTQGCNIYCTAKTDYINCRAVTSRKVDIHGAATLNMKLFCRKKCNVISDFDDNSIETRRSTAPSTSPMGYAEKYVIIEEEIACSNGSASINRILRYDAHPSVTDCKVINDKIMVKGDMSVAITYCAENSSSPQIMKTIIPFSQVVDMQGVTDDCQCETKTSLAFLDIKPKTNMSGECKIFALSAKLLLCSQAFCQNDVPIINDAFSRKFEADIKRKNLSIEKITCTLNERFNCKKSIDLDFNINNIIDVWCFVQNCYTKFADGKMVVNGTLMTGIFACDENNIPVYFEKPTDFEYKIPFCESMGTPHCDPQIEVVSCGFTIISVNKIEIHTELGINAGIYETKEVSLVCDMEVDENKPISRDKQCAMVIYFAEENDSLWDIAQKYSASVNEIMSINKMEDENLFNGKMLLVPLI